MSCCSKEKMERNDNNNTCKSQSAKSDREMYRICPSKLSKRELEDLYFTLLENNLELKKTINGQDDKIRVLSTQVQRMSNSNDKRMSKEMKEGCTTKAFVDEQKDFISELKETNKRMADRIEQLNRKLSSAKQFAKTSPPQTLNPKTLRPPPSVSPPKKHNCLNKDQDNEHVLKLSISTQWEDKSARRSTQTQTAFPLQKRPSKAGQSCDENKCRSLMEELKIKIVTLQEELFNVHDEYSTRIGRLETEVSEVRKENAQVCYERTASEHELQNSVKRTCDVLAQYRLTETKCSELATQLAIEKRKVAELETQLRAGNMSDKVNKTIEDHLITLNETPRECQKCNCGCPPPQLASRAMNGKAPIKTLPPICPGPPKKRDPDDNTKYSPSKGSSISQQVSKSSPTKTISEITNCDTCGCKVQLMSDAVHSPTPEDIMNCETCGCKKKPMSDLKQSPTSAENFNCPECEIRQDSSSQPKDIQCDLCGCSSSKNKVKKKDVECYCPSWAKAGILKSPSALTQDDYSPCIKCCFKDKHGATESPPFKIDKFIPPRGPPTRWSPSKDMDSTKSSKTGDDSSYQDTEEVVLLKQNRELMTRILELQNQVDHMKTRVTEFPEGVPARPSSAGSTRTSSNKSRPMLREYAQKLPLEQIEYNKSIEGGNYEFTKQVPFPTMGSDERVREPGKLLSIEILGNPKGAVRTRNWDNTRAKTVEDADGTIKITEEASADKLSPFELVNDDYREHKTDSYKLKIIEKKKLERPGSSKPESGNVSPKSAPSDVSGPGFNPEKLKYLEAEGIIAKPGLRDGMSKLKGDSTSLTESIPSNPELGFGIPRLASKTSQDKYKAKSDSGQAKKSPAQHRHSTATGRSSPYRARDDMEVLHGKLPVTEALLANHPTAPKQTDETKKKEDCEYCAACSFDKECELIHENATNYRMNKLEMQKERTKKHDQHNSLQIPGPIPTSDNYKREKTRNLCCHVIKPNINGKQTTATADGPANQPDVPLLDKRQNIGTDSIKTDKNILTHDKKDESIKQNKGSPNKEGFIVNPKIYEHNTYAQTYGPAGLTDAPLLDKREDSNDAVEKKPSRIVFSNNNDLDLTYRPQSEHMLPTLLAPTNWCGRATQVERKADVAQSTDQQLAEKSSQAPTNIDSGCHRCVVSLYRRRSGSLRYRTVPVSAEPPVCRCPGQQDGYCTDKPRKKILTSERGTYTVNSKQTDTSPDNTDLEMSYLSDLPMEKEKKRTFKSRPLSPGEDRTTTFTNTYSYYSPPTHSLLSEGEMPATSKPKYTEPDIDKSYLNAAPAHKLETPQAQQMEAALNAISEELRRCRTMMHSQRPAEQSQRASQTLSPEVTPPIALRPCVAKQGIGDKYAPMSIFTLHIGTIVLSDEAVLNSVDKNLVLKWKFYDQAVTMARMHARRVMVFDFSTEYDIKVTEDFLRYLKHEEMAIVICDLDKEEETFASCVLPLRDALLHTNTRADMSLALMAGPQILKERANKAEADTFDTGDEIGVIDLWCLMRADANMLPGINLVIAQPGAASMTGGQSHAGVMPQVLDDYDELDLFMGNVQPAIPLDPTGRNLTYENVEYNRTSRSWGKGKKEAIEPETPQTTSYDDYNRTTGSWGKGKKEAIEPETPQTTSYDEYNRTTGSWGKGKKEAIEPETPQTTSYDPSKYPPMRDWKSRAPATSSTPQFAPRKQYDRVSDAGSARVCRTRGPSQPQSEMIINEVNPKIKSPGDIRHAVERNNRLTDSKAKSNKSEDTFSQAQSSYCSLRSVLTRLQGRGSRITRTHGGNQRSFLEKLRKARANKAEQSKKVTIFPKYVYRKIEESIGDQEPTKHENQKRNPPKLEITVLWLALNEECEAMIDPYVQRVYVAYSFLGRSGAELETPVSLPKPKHYVDKCYFNFKKVFELSNSDLLKLGHMARCRAESPVVENENDCIIFSVVSEPADDPLGLESCVDIGYAYLYLGDLLEYSSGSPGYTEVTPVRAARGSEYVCGVLAVRLDGLDVVRRCLLLTPNDIAGNSK